MKLHHRGLTIDLPDDDPRIPIMEALLFGRSLPPPLPVPVPAEVDVAPPRAAPVEVTQEQRGFWRQLRPVERRELLLLTGGPMRPADVEKALGLSQRKLMGSHSRVARLAVKHGVTARVKTVGRARKGKRYWVQEDCVPWVRALAEEDAAAAARAAPPVTG